MEVRLIAETAGGDGTHIYLMTVLLEGTDDECPGSNGNAGRTGLARRDGRQTKNHCCRVGEDDDDLWKDPMENAKNPSVKSLKQNIPRHHSRSGCIGL